MNLKPSQVAGIEKILALLADPETRRSGRRIFSLTGPAGTGKTTMLKTLSTELALLYELVVTCAPTNKAAQILRQKGVDATTFYKRFYILDERPGAVRGRGEKLRFVPCHLWPAALPDGKIAHCNILILDESSMLTHRSLLEMLQMADVIILVGDGNQLPPVGDRDHPRGYFNTLEHDVTLTEVLRQGEASPILRLATGVREGNARLVAGGVEFFRPKMPAAELILKTRPTCIAYTNAVRKEVNAGYRRILGFRQMWPEVGERVVSLSNFSEDILNGTEGVVTGFDWDFRSTLAKISVDTGDGIFTVSMDMAKFATDQIWEAELGEMITRVVRPERDPAELTFGYCVTAHKAQGSEYDAVLIVDQRSTVAYVAGMEPGDDRITPEEAVQRWFYVAVTRAKTQLFVASKGWMKQLEGEVPN
jgi:exodeoxyribonuclease-5